MSGTHVPPHLSTAHHQMLVGIYNFVERHQRGATAPEMAQRLCIKTLGASRTCMSLVRRGLAVKTGEQYAVTDAGAQLVGRVRAENIEDRDEDDVRRGEVRNSQLVKFADPKCDDCSGFGYVLSPAGESRAPCQCAVNRMVERDLVFRVGGSLVWAANGSIARPA